MTRAALILLAALTACGKPPAAPVSLGAALKKVPRSPLCAQSLPSDWVSSWPVPTGRADGAEYAVLYYGLDRRALDASGLPTIRVTRPRGSAVFTTDGKVSACAAAAGDPAEPLKGERYREAVMRMEEEQYDRASAKLLALTEKAAAAYATKKADKAVLAAYWEQFRLMAEPALWPDYYKLQPAFWEWLAREHGESLPAP